MNKVKQDYNDMAAVVDSVEIKGATRYEKVKFIHDFICKRVEYDEKFEIPTAHEPTSVFLTPYKTVCEGYSESFKILCDKAGIPCVIAVGNSNGGGHAWNYVKMEDGKWYGVDCTLTIRAVFCTTISLWEQPAETGISARVKPLAAAIPKRENVTAAALR